MAAEGDRGSETGGKRFVDLVDFEVVAVVAATRSAIELQSHPPHGLTLGAASKIEIIERST